MQNTSIYTFLYLRLNKWVKMSKILDLSKLQLLEKAAEISLPIHVISQKYVF